MCFLNISSFFLQARILNLRVDFKKHKKFAFIISVAVAMSLGIIPYVEIVDRFHAISVPKSFMPPSYYQLFFCFFYTAQFACASLAVRERFGILNEYLEKFSNRTPVANRVLFVDNPSNFDLKIFTELYNDLCDAILLINQTFTWQLAIVMINMLLCDVFGAYGILQNFFQASSDTQSKFQLFCSSGWIIIQLVPKVLIAYSGSSSTSEMERSSVVLTRVIMNADTFNQKVELNFLLNQMRGRKNTFENIFFVVDWKIISAVSFLTKNLNWLIIYFFPDHISACDISDYHNSV